MQRLDQQLRSYETGTTRQIAVAIFPALDGEALEDFSIRLAEKWQIGSRKNSDGVLITVFIADHRDRIDVGYGLEDKLTDALAARIQRELMEPRFKQGDFEGGLREAIGAIDTATGGHAHDEGKLPARAPGNANDSSGGSIFLIIIFFVIVLPIILRFVRRGGGGGGFGGGFFLGGGSGWSSGGGGWSGGGGGGGWSGGGGSFGGGGSSGSW